jgi:hypothetical protein
MDTGKEIIQFTKGLLENLPKIDDIIDKALEPIKDYTDTFGDIASPIKALVSISNLRKKLTLKSFIKNYASELTNGFEITKDETLKLESFFKEKKNIQFVAETIDNAINAKSLKCSAILGSIAGIIIKNKIELDFIYLSLIESLKMMTDKDLGNFVMLYEYLPIIGIAHDQTDEYRTRDFYKVENVNQIQTDKLSLDSTIEKLKRTDALTYNAGGIGQSGNGKGCFEINEVTKKLYEIIKVTQILD